MIRSLLRLRETPPPDAADALAVAITHFQNAASLRAMDREAGRV
jgi:crossover junction endodeoxyribonuclease RuvC